MATLNAEKQALEETLSQPASPATLADTGRRLKAVNDELESLELRWLELGEQLEVATSDGDATA